YSTYLPGTGDAASLALDPQGNAWIAGKGAIGMPLVNPLQPSLGGSYVMKLTSFGALDFSTYVGVFPDAIAAIAAGPKGAAWAAGKAFSADFLGGASGTPPGYSGFLARLDAASPPAVTGVPQV